MDLDFSESEQSDFTADVCVIGAGAAGFACALSFLDTSIKVIILEGGRRSFCEEAADLHKADITNHHHLGVHEARERIVGGTTTKWGGQALPFMKEDFLVRKHLSASGWPISYEELQPYYQKAEAVLGTDQTTSFNYAPWKDHSVAEPVFSRDTISLFVTKWCKTPNFALQHGEKIRAASHITLLSNANVIELLPNVGFDAVEELRIKSLDGKEGSVRARYIIAAGGAIETVRLFLASKKFGEDGLANKHDLVGRYFQDHCAAIAGQIIPDSRRRFHAIFDPFYKNGYKYFPRIKLNPQLASQSQLLHCSGQIVFSDVMDGALAHAKKLMAFVRNRQLPSIHEIRSLLSPDKMLAIGRAAWRLKVKKRGSSPASGPIWLEVHSEQEPLYDSRITLSDKVDHLGMPRVKLHWSISELTVKTIKEMARLTALEFQNSKIGKLKLEPWVIHKKNDKPLRWIIDTFHQAGGLKMSTNEQDGVVDTACKVFGMRNLYVASSAVFPTSSFSNSTMTIIALAIRVCETVKLRISEDQQVNSRQQKRTENIEISEN
jgi:choline dehydrogenase-like flavoprotein